MPLSIVARTSCGSTFTRPRWVSTPYLHVIMHMHLIFGTHTLRDYELPAGGLSPLRPSSPQAPQTTALATRCRTWPCWRLQCLARSEWLLASWIRPWASPAVEPGGQRVQMSAQEAQAGWGSTLITAITWSFMRTVVSTGPNAFSQHSRLPQ